MKLHPAEIEWNRRYALVPTPPKSTLCIPKQVGQPKPPKQRKRKLTARQWEVLGIIERLINEKGFSPSIREIADALGGINVNAASIHVRALAKKGFISYVPNMARTIRLIEREEVSSGS